VEHTDVTEKTEAQINYATDLNFGFFHFQIFVILPSFLEEEYLLGSFS
jgi:hypothetical protein